MENEINKNVNEEETSKEVSQEPQESHAPDFDAWINEKPKRRYVRLETDVPKVVRFKSGKPYKDDMTDFKGKSRKGKVPVYSFAVTTPEEPNEEIDFDVTSKRLGSDIKAYYEKGFAELEITKLGTNPVSYRVIPMVARQQQRQMSIAS